VTAAAGARSRRAAPHGRARIGVDDLHARRHELARVLGTHIPAISVSGTHTVIGLLRLFAEALARLFALRNRARPLDLRCEKIIRTARRDFPHYRDSVDERNVPRRECVSNVNSERNRKNSCVSMRKPARSKARSEFASVSRVCWTDLMGAVDIHMRTRPCPVSGA
jgi:hypothetical protein